MKVDSDSWPALSRHSNPLNQDVCILYQGGSGGFALYYYLLLSGNFQHSIDETWEMINRQFSPDLIRDRSRWKTQEIWPNNQELKQLAGRKLFLVCNPLWSDYMIDVNHSISDNTYKILLYAPLKLQLRMAWEKRAYWFTDVSRQTFAAPTSDRKYIRWILQNSAWFNGTTVDPRVPDIIKQFVPERILRLDEFVTSTANTDQRQFLNLWTSLQSKKALNLMTL